MRVYSTSCTSYLIQPDTMRLSRATQEYLKAMIDVMHQAEDLESLENLHPLCLLMQTIRASCLDIPRARSAHAQLSYDERSRHV